MVISCREKDHDANQSKVLDQRRLITQRKQKEEIADHFLVIITTGVRLLYNFMISRPQNLLLGSYLFFVHFHCIFYKTKCDPDDG